MNKVAFLEASAKYYDASTDYDSIMAYFDIMEMKPYFAGKRFLELGSSAGTITKKLVPYCDSLDIVEASALALSRTKKELASERKVKYYACLWEKFSPRERYSDIIFVRGLEHVSNQSAFLKRISCWLLPGGRIHIIVPNAYSVHKLLLLAQGRIQSLFELSERDKNLGHTIIYDLRTLRAHVQKAKCLLVCEKTFFFKPCKHDVMRRVSLNIHNPLHSVLYLVGGFFPKWGAQIYVVCTPNESAEI